jgi:deoxyribodipyrimidine photo-lyase
MVRRAIAWFRNDLRVRDNALLQYRELQDAQEMIAVYCVDPRHFGSSSWGGHIRTGGHRARFLAESLEALGQSLARLGARLIVAVGRPEEVLPQLLCVGDVLVYQKEDTSEERAVEDTLLTKLPEGTRTRSHWGQTLFDRDDLGFDPQKELPIPFGKFKFGICDKIVPRKEFPMPSALAPPPRSDEVGSNLQRVSFDVPSLMRTMTSLAPGGCSDPTATVADTESVIPWRGGEAAGLERLRDYVATGLGTYHRTRNQLQGPNHSSHLSPWIANGSLSVRTVYWAVKEFERSHAEDPKAGNFDHVYKFIFELSWRDYFRLYCARFGTSVFHVGGPAGRRRAWRRVPDVEERWKKGLTGVPLVDALMRELLATGYMANRGRYIVASYLVHYLGIDWRVGADWFESLLIDHDVCSNYGEWASMAGVAAAPTKDQPLGLKGKGPSSGRSRGAQGSGGNPWAQGLDSGDAVFDPWQQGLQYDRDESYVRRWVPELRRTPKGTAHWPHDLSKSEWTSAGCGSYPSPLAEAPFNFGKSTEARSTHRDSTSKRSRESISGDPNPKVSMASHRKNDYTEGRRRWRGKYQHSDGRWPHSAAVGA